MIKRAYLAISYSNRKYFDKEIESLKQLFERNNIELFVFVDHYNFKPNQEKEMMKTAFMEVDNSDILVAELSTKSIGVGIEIGYALAKKKTIIYLRKKDSEHSTTAAGSSDYQIIYEDIFELESQLNEHFFKS